MTCAELAPYHPVMATRTEIRERLATESTERLWWMWRFLELVLRDFGHDRLVGDDDASFAVKAFARLTASDPEWAIAKLADEGPEGHGFSRLLEGQRIDAALASLETST